MSLPRLPNIKQLTPNITRILGQNPRGFTLQGTNTYLLGEPSTPSRILVDCGEGLDEYTQVLGEYMIAHNLKLDAILVTHWHKDHLGGVPSVLERFGQVPVYKYPDSHDFEYNIAITAVHDGQVLERCGMRLEIMHTPGHAADHLVVWVHNDGILLSADNVLGHGTTSYEDYGLYMKSLHRMAAIPGLGHIFPGHGEIVADGPAKVSEYIEHRLARERQVLQVIREHGPITSGEITKKIYENLAPEIMGAANRGVEQFLAKLEQERKIQNKNKSYSCM